MNIAELRRLEAEARPRDLVLILRTEAQNQRTPPVEYVIADDGGRMVHRPEPDIAMAELLEEAACALAEKDKEIAALKKGPHADWWQDYHEWLEDRNAGGNDAE